MEGISGIGCSNEGMKFGTPFVPERGFYQPSTDTWESYLALLGVVEQQLGGFSPLVLCGVAHEVLSVLKCENIKNLKEKKAEIERLLKPVADHTFEQLVEISSCITDYFRDHNIDRFGEAALADGRDILFVPEEGFYQPRTEETWTAYKLLLDVIKCQIGDQPELILCTVAHEVLLILKNEKTQKPETQREMLDNLLNKISDNNFDHLVLVAGMICDFDDRGSTNPLKTEPPFASPMSIDHDQNQNQWSVQNLQEEQDQSVVNEVVDSSPIQQSEWNQMIGGVDHDDATDDISQKLSQLTTDDDSGFYNILQGSEEEELEEEEEDDDDDNEDEDEDDEFQEAKEEDEEWVIVDHPML